MVVSVRTAEVDAHADAKKAETLSGAVGHEPRKLLCANRQMPFQANPAREVSGGNGTMDFEAEHLYAF